MKNAMDSHTHNLRVQRHALWALLHIALTSMTLPVAAVPGCGGDVVTRAALSHRSPPPPPTDENRDAIFEVGMLPSILAAMTDHLDVARVVTVGLQVVSNLAAHHGKDSMRANKPGLPLACFAVWAGRD